MDTEILNKEKMDAIKELSGVQAQVSKGREVLSELKETTAEYLASRKEATIKVIREVFEHSKTIVSQINKNYEEVKAYHNETRGFVAELIGMSKGLRDLKETLDEYLESEQGKLNTRTQELSDIEAELKDQAENIKLDRDVFNKEKEELDKEWVKAKDERATLERAFARLKVNKK